MIRTLFSFRYAIGFLLFIALAMHAFTVNKEIRISTINAMETALKNIYVDSDNNVLINKLEAENDLNTYLQKNLKLDSSLNSIGDDNPIYGNVKVESIQIYDQSTTGLPILIDGVQYNYPTMRLKVSLNVKFLFSEFFKLPLSYPVHIDMIESNEPYQ